MARNSKSLEVRLGDYGFTPPHLEYGRKPLPKDHYGLGPVRSDPDWFTHGGFSSQEAMDFARRLGFSTAQELRKFADTFGFGPNDMNDRDWQSRLISLFQEKGINSRNDFYRKWDVKTNDWLVEDPGPGPKAPYINPTPQAPSRNRLVPEWADPPGSTGLWMLGPDGKYWSRGKGAQALDEKFDRNRYRTHKVEALGMAGINKPGHFADWDDFGRIFIIPSDQAFQSADARNSGDTEWGFKFGEHAGTFVGNTHHGWNIIPAKSSGQTGGYPLLEGPDPLSTPQGRAAISGEPTAWDQVAPPDFLDTHFVPRSLDETGKLVPITANDRAYARKKWIERLQTHRLWDPNKSKLPVSQREGSGTKEDPYRIVSYPFGHPSIIPGAEWTGPEKEPWVRQPDPKGKTGGLPPKTGDLNWQEWFDEVMKYIKTLDPNDPKNQELIKKLSSMTDPADPVDLFKKSPLYRYQEKEGTKAINRQLKARGLYRSSYGANTLSQFYNKLLAEGTERQLDRLRDAGYTGLQSASAGVASGANTSSQMQKLMENLGRMQQQSTLGGAAQQGSLYSLLGSLPGAATNLFDAINRSGSNSYLSGGGW